MIYYNATIEFTDYEPDKLDFSAADFTSLLEKVKTHILIDIGSENNGFSFEYLDTITINKIELDTNQENMMRLIDYKKPNYNSYKVIYKSDDFDEFLDYLSEHNSPIDIHNILYWSIFNDDLEMLKEHLRQGANIKDDYPLYYAFENNKSEFFEFILHNYNNNKALTKKDVRHISSLLNKEHLPKLKQVLLSLPSNKNNTNFHNQPIPDNNMSL